MANILEMNQTQIRQQGQQIITTMLQQYGTSVEQIQQKIASAEGNMLTGGLVRNFINNAASTNGIQAQASASATVRSVFDNMVNIASDTLDQVSDRVARENPNLAGPDLANKIAQETQAALNGNQQFTNQLNFANQLVSQGRNFVPELQQVPTLTTNLFVAPLQTWLTSNVPSQRGTPAPQTPASQPQPPQNNPTPPQQENPTPQTNPAPVAQQPRTPQAIPAVHTTSVTTQPATPPVTNVQNPNPQQPTANPVNNPPTTPTVQPPANQDPAPRSLDARNADNILKGLAEDGIIRDEAGFNAVKNALTQGLENGNGDFLSNIFGNIGKFLMAVFAGFQAMFSGGSFGEAFQNYNAGSGTGQQMRNVLQNLNEMSPVEIGYSDPSTGVTGADLVDAHTYRMAVVRAERDLETLRGSRRQITRNELENAQLRLEEAQAAFNEFDQGFQAKFGESAEVAFKKFEDYKQNLLYATAEQLGIEARANGLVDTPQAAELMQAYRTNSAPSSLAHTMRNSEQSNENRQPSQREENNQPQQDYSNPDNYRRNNPSLDISSASSFEVSSSSRIDAPVATPANRSQPSESLALGG